jgi:DNA-binding transcriptional MerR regulator
MLKIGEFSKLSRVSVRMLRHYDEIGLLKPAEVDSVTDYRYYHEEQLLAVSRIRALRDMGFSLADVKRMLEVYGDRGALEGFFDDRQRELEDQLLETKRRLTLLKAYRERLQEEEHMNFDVTIKTIPERYAATVHTTIPRYEEEGMVWSTLVSETCRMNLREADPCLCAMTYLDGEYKEEDVEVMAWKTVEGTYADTAHVRFLTFPEVTVASCTFKGSYGQIVDVYAAVVAWIEANGYECDGAMFNIYHVSPHETADPREFVTEVCYPIKERSNA